MPPTLTLPSALEPEEVEEEATASSPCGCCPEGWAPFRECWRLTPAELGREARLGALPPADLQDLQGETPEQSTSIQACCWLRCVRWKVDDKARRCHPSHPPDRATPEKAPPKGHFAREAFVKQVSELGLSTPEPGLMQAGNAELLSFFSSRICCRGIRARLRKAKPVLQEGARAQQLFEVGPTTMVGGESGLCEGPGLCREGRQLDAMPEKKNSRRSRKTISAPTPATKELGCKRLGVGGGFAKPGLAFESQDSCFSDAGL